MFYADDSVPMTPSPVPLQNILDICFEYPCEFELKYNIRNTAYMVVKPKRLKHLNNPVFTLDGLELDFTNMEMYL